VAIVERSIDVGVVQPESFQVQVRATLDRYAALLEREPEFVDAEADELRRTGACAVVADIPSAAFVIAARASLPGIGVANFSWDWIYEPFLAVAPDRNGLVDHLRTQYRQASLLLRLPLHDGLTAFPRVEDVPLIARVSDADLGATRRRLGLPLEAPIVLLSFGGFEFHGLDVERLHALRDYAFVWTESAGRLDGTARRTGNLYTLPRHGYPYVDLVAACDAVVAKPGYGIAADCLANRVPILYSPRGWFREEPALGRELERLGHAVQLPREALAAWNLKPHLDTLLGLNHAWAEIRLDGAEVAARRILDMAS
jgi:L-arabinokinase